MSRFVRNTYEDVFDTLRRTDKPKATWNKVLRTYNKSLWCAQHITVLLAATGREMLELLSEETKKNVEMDFSSLFFGHCNVSHASRALWSVGKLGKLFMDNYKQVWAELDLGQDIIHAGLALAQIGHRHAHLRAEVRKAIDAAPARVAADAPAWKRGIVPAIGHFVAKSFDEPEYVTSKLKEFGGRIAEALGRELPAGHRYRFERHEDVPDEIAMPLAITVNRAFNVKFEHTMALWYALPWMARAKAEDLYLPRDYVATVQNHPWTPEHTLMWFRPLVAHEKLGRQQKPGGPARNGACPCGSGKKYKRCCAEA